MFEPARQLDLCRDPGRHVCDEEESEMGSFFILVLPLWIEQQPLKLDWISKQRRKRSESWFQRRADEWIHGAQDGIEGDQRYQLMYSCTRNAC